MSSIIPEIIKWIKEFINEKKHQVFVFSSLVLSAIIYFVLNNQIPIRVVCASAIPPIIAIGIVAAQKKHRRSILISTIMVVMLFVFFLNEYLSPSREIAALMHEAKDSKEAHSFEYSSNLFTDAFNLAQKHGQNEAILECVCKIGELLYYMGKCNVARKKLEECHDIATGSKSEEWIAHSNFFSGEVENQSDNNDLARVHYTDAIESYIKLKNFEGIGDAHRGMAQLERELSNYESAEVEYTLGMIFYKLGKYRKGEANIYRGLGHLAVMRTKYSKARYYYNKAIPLFKEEEDAAGEANVLRGIGDLEFSLGNYNAARGNYKKARGIFNKEKLKLNEANALLGLGKLETREKKYKSAQKYFNEALAMYHNKEQKNNGGLANVFRAMGDMENARENIERACHDFKISLQCYVDAENPTGEEEIQKQLNDMQCTNNKGQATQCSAPNMDVSYGGLTQPVSVAR
ncbi:MAG: tetratricopeptide repeat protein [Deltaproteobacteria bacterium]|nr:tetratricopeptide repeat protein [Deltaproteobacteria bacterium]